MEIKRRSNFNLLKRITIILIFFCFIVFILFNYICSANQCYWKSDRYNLQTSLLNRLANQQTIKEIDYLRIDQNELNSDQLISLKRKSRLINHSNESNSRFKYLNLINHQSNNQSLLNLNQISYNQITKSRNLNYQFNLAKDDVIIFLHIQKTGGTSFGKRLVHDLLLNKPCECFKDRKHCSCLRPEELNDDFKGKTNETAKLMNSIQKSTKIKSKYWLFSRYSTGWICGLHADFTQLNFCANDALNRIEKVRVRRRFFFITILRDPVSRVLSEWLHIRRGATWSASKNACSFEFDASNENTSNELANENQADLFNCSHSKNWKADVNLGDFLKCDSNLARQMLNRMTRMLADLTRVGCLNRSTSDQSQIEYNRLLLESAKANLNRLAYFGLLEFQKVSQFIFESTFNLNFQHSFIQLNKTHSTQIKTQNKTIELIRKLNYLDIELYGYAKELLFKRLGELRKTKNFEEFEHSKRDSLALDNFEMNLDKFPELRLLKKLSRENNLR